MKIKRRVQLLQEKLPPPPPDKALRQKRLEKVVARFCRQLEQAAALLSAAEEQAVVKALADLADDDRSDDDGLDNPYGCWLRDLEDGWCHLPKLPPAAMKELVVAWSSPGVSGAVVCKNCGVEYPHQNHRGIP
jgi:hypothetical protein